MKSNGGCRTDDYGHANMYLWNVMSNSFNNGGC